MKNQQGVRSKLIFPLGQDEIAVSMAINNLLNEGWKFSELTKNEIVLTRGWDFIPDENKGLEEVPSNNQLKVTKDKGE